MSSGKQDVKREVENFKQHFKKEAEELIQTVFPSKILELRDLYEEMKKSPMSSIHFDINIPVPEPLTCANGPKEGSRKKRRVEPMEGDEGNNVRDFPVVEDITGTRVLALPNGTAPVNIHIRELCERLKPLIRELVEHANVIKMWITLLIPKIEDGNNFGVSIQEETLAEARQVETEAATYLEQISRYFLNRAKIITKVAKYPHVEDYRQAVLELDEKEFICLQLTCCELRNHYATLHDIIQKNMDKIKKPRNANADTMY